MSTSPPRLSGAATEKRVALRRGSLSNGAVAYPTETPHRIRGIVFALAAFVAATSFASDIKLISGQVYSNVAILNRDAQRVQFKVPTGSITVPLPIIESIDGVRLREAPPVFPARKESAPDGLAISASSSAGASVSTAPGQWPPYDRRWKMDLLLLAVAGISALWLGSVGRVQRELFQQQRDPRLWSNLAIALPGFGYLLFTISELVGKTAEHHSSGKGLKDLNEADAERDRQKRAIRDGNLTPP